MAGSDVLQRIGVDCIFAPMIYYSQHSDDFRFDSQLVCICFFCSLVTMLLLMYAPNFSIFTWYHLDDAPFRC